MRQTWKTQLLLAISHFHLSFFSFEGFCYSYAWSWNLCEGKLLFVQDLSLENSEHSYLCLWVASLPRMTYFFYWSLYSSLCMKFFWWIPLLIYFVFGNFSINQKKWLTWPGGADKLQAILLKWLTALLGSLTVILTALLFWNYFYLLTFAFSME